MSTTLALVIAILLFTAHAARAADYIVVFEGTDTEAGFEVGGSNLLNLNAALAAITNVGGVVTSDLTKQMGVAIVSSANPLFIDTLRANPLVEAVGEDLPFRFSHEESGTPASVDPFAPSITGEDPLEFGQWDLRMVRAPEGRALANGGKPGVKVAVLDTGLDVAHQDFWLAGQTNIDLANARSFVGGIESPIVAPGLHGTWVSGFIGARKNGIGIVGVAPNVTIVPIQVEALFDDTAHFSWLVMALEYAARIGSDVINMSFGMNSTSASIELTDLQGAIGGTDDVTGEMDPFFCRSNPEHIAAIKALDRAVHSARKHGALPVAALNNEHRDMSADDDCDLFPAETPGVVGVGALEFSGALPDYSNYGLGAVDLVAPGGNLPGSSVAAGSEPCLGGSLATSPGNTYICNGGTSFASPIVSGVAALIVSQFGKFGSDGELEMKPGAVEDVLHGSAIDIGTQGEDLCYGLGRVDALRAATRDTSYERGTVLGCRHPVPLPSSCPGPQITDVTGDGLNVELNLGTHLERDPSVDIVSASFVQGDNSDLRIALAIEDLTNPPAQGGLWTVGFQSNGTDYVVQAQVVTGSPASYSVATANETTRITGSFNELPNTIIFDVPLSAIDAAVGSTLTQLEAVTYYTAAGLSTSEARDRAPDAAGTYGADYTIGEQCDPMAQ